MELHRKKRIEIIIERVVARQLTDVLDRAGVQGYTVFPAQGGRGQDGVWDRNGLVSAAGHMVAIVCILDPSRLDDTLEQIYSVVERQIGIVAISDVEVIRSDHF